MKLEPILCPSNGALILVDMDARGEIVATVNRERPDADVECALVASAVTACHGLDLPPDVEPGILAEAVAAMDELRRAADANIKPLTPSMRKAVVSIRAILSKLTT